MTLREFAKGYDGNIMLKAFENEKSTAPAAIMMTQITDSIKDEVLDKEVYSYTMVCASLFERYLLENYGINATRDHYISTTLLSICLFLLAISFSQMRSSVWVLLGAKYSLYIYVLHPLVDYCFKYLNKMLMPHCWNYYYYYGAPFIILISTIMMIEGWICVQEKLYLNVGKKRKYK